ncbi:hypothetical protein [Cobetia marina]|uniref:hypothetical protein n=1 Tax=Cobetia marina TaxID=28258 RepID=UPI00174ADA51
MRFYNIDTFEQRMATQSVSIAFFCFKYHNCTLEIAYSRKQRKFIIAFVDHNLGFTCSVDNGFVCSYINHKDAVKQLMRCRNHDKYDPKDFLELLDAYLPEANFCQVNDKRYNYILSRAVSNFEDRIYFNHWRSSNMTDRQKEKTIELMGYEVLYFCKENHVIPVFFAHPTSRTLAAFEDYKADYFVNGTKI